MQIVRVAGYKVINLWDGAALPEAVRTIRSGKANGINLNYTRNFPESIEEVRGEGKIKYIQVNYYSKDAPYDYSAIHSLAGLESIGVYTTDRLEIRFHEFPALKSAELFWRPRAS